MISGSGGGGMCKFWAEEKRHVSLTVKPAPGYSVGQVSAVKLRL